MRTLTCTPQEQYLILANLTSYRDEEHIDLDIELPRGILVNVYGNINVDYYTEPETGGTYAISRDCDVTFTAYDEAGNEYELDERTFEIAKHELMRLECPMLATFKTA